MTKDGDQHLVSIIIPSYNVEKYLAEACNSVIAQTYNNWEAIIVDDGSIDETNIIAKEFCSKDNRFKCFYQENCGLSAARKTGIDNSKGEFIQFLDADDVLLPTRLERMVSESLNAEENIVLYSDYWIGLHDSVSGEIVPSSRPAGINRDIYFDDMFYNWRETFLFVPACVFYRIKCFQNIKYDSSLRSVEDWDLYLNILKKGYCFRLIAEKLVLYRDNPDGLSKDKTFIYTCLFKVLNKWKDTTSFSKRYFVKKSAIIFAGVMFDYSRKATKKIVFPVLENETNRLKIFWFNIRVFFIATYYFLLKYFIIIKNKIMKTVKLNKA